MGIFFKITAPNGEMSYLFGVLHTANTVDITLPVEVKSVFEQATNYVFEASTLKFKEDPNIVETLYRDWLNDQTQYSAQISQDYISSAQVNFKKIWDKIVKKNPEMASQTDEGMRNILQVPPLDLAYFMMNGKTPSSDSEKRPDTLDERLMKNVTSKNKETTYLESAEEQHILFCGFNLNILEQIEVYAFIELELTKGRKFKSLEDLEQAYQQQDIQKLQDFYRIFPTSTGLPEPVCQHFDGISINRDFKLTERMMPSLDKGNAFITVGAGNLKGITDKLQMGGYTVEAVPLGKRYTPIESTGEDEEKVAAFKKIYMALFSAQTSFFKKRGFMPTDDKLVSLNNIQDYLNTHKNTRTHKAWALAEKHYMNISSNNSELLKSICQEGYSKSSGFLGLFKRTRTNLNSDQAITEAAPETRTGTVRDILNGPLI